MNVLCQQTHELDLKLIKILEKQTIIILKKKKAINKEVEKHNKKQKLVVKFENWFEHEVEMSQSKYFASLFNYEIVELNNTFLLVYLL